MHSQNIFCVELSQYSYEFFHMIGMSFAYFLCEWYSWIYLHVSATLSSYVSSSLHCVCGVRVFSIRRAEENLGVFSGTIQFFWGRVSLKGQEFLKRLACLARKPQRSTLICIPSTEITSVCTMLIRYLLLY